MKFEKDQIKTFINPVIEAYSPKGMQLSREKCSSLPGKEYIRVRNNDIRVMYQRPTGEAESNRLLGKAALVFQHEMDHLEGVLISDIGLEVIPEFDEATDEERAEVIKEYLDSLDIRVKEINKEIEDVKKILKECMESVCNFEVPLTVSVGSGKNLFECK